MRFKQVIQSGCLAVSLLLVSMPWSSPAGAVSQMPVNLVQNGSFEDGSSTAWMMEGSTSAISIQAKDNHTEGGSHSAAYWANSAFHFRVSQTIDGLADGTYRLSAWTQGGGGEKSSRLFAKVSGEEEMMADFINTGYADWKNPQLTHVNIRVANGSCTIGFEVEGLPGNWGSVDDVSLVWIGDLNTSPAPLTIQPVQVTTWQHAAPQLPSVVKAVYSDDLSYVNVPVHWESVHESVYAQTGQFQVLGKIQGSDTPALATVIVTLKSADLNGDQIVNVADLALAVYYLHQTDGAALQADLNNDGVVDQTDIQLISEQLLQTD